MHITIPYIYTDQIEAIKQMISIFGLFKRIISMKEDREIEKEKGTDN